MNKREHVLLFLLFCCLPKFVWATCQQSKGENGQSQEIQAVYIAAYIALYRLIEVMGIKENRWYCCRGYCIARVLRQ
jgi:hypothetical protein